MSSIVLKVVFNGSAHRFTLAKPSMSDLIAQLKLSYPTLPTDANIKYEDDENELITISTDNELMEAFNVAVAQGSRTLKLIVSAPSTAASTSSLSSSNVEDNQETKQAAISRAASPARVVSPPRNVEATKVASPKPATATAPATPKPASPAPATPKPEPVKASAAPASAAAPQAKAASAEADEKLPTREEIVDLLLSLIKNTEFQAILPQVLNAVLDELAKPQRTVKTIVDRILAFGPIRDHVFTMRMLPFVDRVAPCVDARLGLLNPALIAMARPMVPLVAPMIPSAVAFLERLKASAAECPLGDILGGLGPLAGLFGGLGGPCGLAGLAKMFGPPRACGNGDVEFDLGSIPIPPFLSHLLSGLAGGGGAAETGESPRAQSQPRGPCERGPCERGPCGERGPCERGPCSPWARGGGGQCARGPCGDADRSQSMPRGGRHGGHHGHHGGRHGGRHHGGPFAGPHPHPFGPFGHHGGPFAGPHPHPHPHGPFPHPYPHGPFHRAPDMSPPEGQPHVWRNFACDGCNVQPIEGIRYHCTICKDFDLCEACEAKGVHPRHHPLIKLHVPRPPPSDDSAVHHGVTCDMCHVSPISGLRYKCTVCPDFDMCEKCEAKRLHPADHPVIMLRTERHLPPHLPPFFQGEGPRSPPTAEEGGFGGCPRRGGGGGGRGRCGRWRRFMEAAAAEAAAANGSSSACASSSSACESKQAKEDSTVGGCPMFERSCGPQEPVPAVKGPQAVLVRHVTLAHGSKLEQGQVLVKTWSVQNNGSESWPASTKLIFLRGDRDLLGETEEFSVVSAQPGQTIEVSIPITTPTKAGNYSAYFQLADQDRNVFGPRLWLEILVTRDEEDERKLSSPSSTSAASAPLPSVDTSGWIDVKVETSPVVKPVVTPAATAVPVTSLNAPAVTSSSSVAVPKPAVAAVPTPSAPPKFAAQLASLSSMGFNNAELNSFLLEKHNGDIQQVSNWLLENMNH